MLQQYLNVNSELQLKRIELQLPTTSVCSSTQLSQQFQNVNPEQAFILKDLLPPVENIYEIKSSNVIGNKISSLLRFRILKLLQNQTEKQSYSREIFALASYYLDLYIKKKDSISLGNMHTMALGAIMVATKIYGARFPQIGGDFQKQQVFDAELQICMSLQYFLNPKTYIFYLDLLTSKWDNFVDQNQQLDIKQKYLVQTGSSYVKFRVLYQRMEFVNMIGQITRYSLPQLAFNLFFIQSSLNFQTTEFKPFQTKKQQNIYIKSSYKLKNKYGQLFVSFSKFCGIDDLFLNLLDQKIGIDLAKILILPIQLTAPTRLALNYDSYRKMQTINTLALERLENQLKSKKLK